MVSSMNQGMNANGLTFLGLNEYFSDFANIGHNSAFNLFWLWVLPNGLWLVFPVYMIYVLGKEVVESMGGPDREKQE